MLSEHQKQYLIDLIQNGKEIPEDFKYLLFPTSQQEYELTYAGKMSKEDLLANEDGTFPVPIQVDRVYNGTAYKGFDDGWKNMIVFGDNLQFLKTIYENKVPIIKYKVKGKVKLIYIDPPFATSDEFRSTLGAKAYNDKKKGSEFLEFLRRRLILAREILADDGSIYVHMDQKMGHYVKVIMDEVFGKNNFRNDIVWWYLWGGRGKTTWNSKHDNILFYSKSDKWTFNYMEVLEEHQLMTEGSKNRLNYKGAMVTTKSESSIIPEHKVLPSDTWYVATINAMSKEKLDFPTQKPEELIVKLIKASTNEGDIVLDFFGGSGTTMSVAEKLNRRWITCDLGKFSYFTMQKRILQIDNSKSLDNPKKDYGEKARSFMTATLGMYDLEKTFGLEWEKYSEFVSDLFEVDNSVFTINGITFEGKKRGFPVKIFNYVKFKDTAIDDYYLKNLNEYLSGRGIERIYIIAPATRVNYIADYQEEGDIRYYFLKVPYEMIRELHKKPFQRLRQPRSKDDINRIEEMIGFQFVFPPEVKSMIKQDKNNIILQVKEFKSHYLQDDKGRMYRNFETLSSVYIDYNYNGQTFEMDEAFFADEIMLKQKSKQDIDLEEFEKDGIEIILPRKKLGQSIMVVYSDIYGNDFTEKLEIKGN